MSNKELSEYLDIHILQLYNIKDKNFRKRIIDNYTDSLDIYCSIVSAFIREKDEEERKNIKNDLNEFEKEVLHKPFDWKN